VQSGLTQGVVFAVADSRTQHSATADRQAALPHWVHAISAAHCYPLLCSGVMIHVWRPCKYWKRFNYVIALFASDQHPIASDGKRIDMHGPG